MDDRRFLLKREQDTTRTKTSLARLGWSTVKAGVGLVPFGSLVAEGIEIAVKHVLGYREERAKERLTHFAECVIKGTNDEERAELLSHEFEESDLHAVLSALVKDEDNEKTEVYAHTFRSLIKDEVPEAYRSHIIHTVSALSWADLELARKIYIHGHFHFPTYNASPPDTKKQVSQLLETTDSLKRVSLQSLLSRGLLLESLPKGTAATTNKLMPGYLTSTELLDMVVNAAYPPEELVPVAIGLRERSQIADMLGVFFASIIEEDTTNLLGKLRARLYQTEIQSMIANPRWPQRTSMVAPMAGNSNRDLHYKIREPHLSDQADGRSFEEGGGSCLAARRNR